MGDGLGPSGSTEDSDFLQLEVFASSERKDALFLSASCMALTQLSTYRFVDSATVSVTFRPVLLSSSFSSTFDSN